MFVDLRILYHPCIPRMNPTWSWCIIFFVAFLKIFIVIQLQLYAFSPLLSTPPQLNPPPSPTSTITPDFVHVSFNSSCNALFPLSPPHSPRPLLDCSQPQCLWLYFCFFLLLIMFQLRVRSYGIYPSSPGLFHLA